MTSLGRIDPVTHNPDGTPIDPDAPASPHVLRQMHRELVQGKGRDLLTSSPLLLLALAALVAGGAFPDVVGFLLSVGVIGIGAYTQEAFEWFTLRRADPLTLQETEARERAERSAFENDFRTRAKAQVPVATLALMGAISTVTIVQFVRMTQTSPAVIGSAALVKSAVRAGEWWRLLTATYLHGSALHLLGNLGALVALGEIFEVYEGRMRLPLVYLVAAIAGSACSVLLLKATSVGASGGILGVAGYLVTAAGRGSAGTPRLVRGRMVRLLASTALVGLAGFSFVDNGAHLGGILGGTALGLTLPRGDARRERLVARLGTAASAILLAGAAFTIYRLLR